MLVKAKQSGYKKTFDMKLDSLDEKTQRGYVIALGILRNSILSSMVI